MKAILVIDVDDKYLGKEISLIKFTDGNAIYCSAELKPMPQKKEVSDDSYVADYVDFDLGWNACIDTITGETE